MEETTFSHIGETILTNDLIREILSWLPVKSLLRFTCVSRWFQQLILDPTFVKVHLKKASKHSHFLIMFKTQDDRFLVSPCSLPCLLQNNHEHDLLEAPEIFGEHYHGVSSCNGLVAVNFCSGSVHPAFTLIIWNPTTRTNFQVPRFTFPDIEVGDISSDISFGFGYDDRSNTYKVVAIISYYDNMMESCNEVKIYSIGSKNGWRTIEKFPVDSAFLMGDYGKYFNSNIVWLTTTEEFEYVVIFLDLQIETFTEVLLPEGVEGDIDTPEIMILEDYVSVAFKDFATNTFVVWQMKDFGNRDSWSLLVNIDVEVLQTQPGYILKLLCIQGRFLVFYQLNFEYHMHVIWYDLREREVARRRISTEVDSVWIEDYVPSLQSLGA